MNNTSMKSGGGCLKTFSIGCLVVAVIGIAALIIGGCCLKAWLNRMVEEYTDTEPRALPVLAVSQDRIDAVLARVSAFAEAIRNDQPAQPLVLSSDDLNVLIQNHPEWKDVAGKVYATIENDSIHGQVSFPLDELGSLTEGRFLNGSASFNVGMTGDQLAVYITSVEVNGKQLPDDIMKGLKTTNMAEESNKDPEASAVLSKLESIAVANDRLVIVPKKTQ